MKYYKVTYSTPLVGTEMEEYIEIDNSVSFEELEENCMETCIEHAQNYSYDVEEEDLENYYADCYYNIEEITKEEYDKTH